MRSRSEKRLRKNWENIQEKLNPKIFNNYLDISLVLLLTSFSNKYRDNSYENI